MRVLITGAAGQVGRALQKTAPRDATIIAMTKADLDIANGAEIARVMKECRPELVFNAAAYTDVDRAEQESVRAQAINAAAVGVLAAEAAKARARFVHVSTDYVFGGTRRRPYMPDDEPDPVNAYGRSKRDGEKIAIERNSASLIVRTAWVYDRNTRNFVGSVLESMKDRVAIRVVDDQIGTPTYAPDLARALWSLAHRGAQGIFHYTDSGVASRYEFAMAVRESALALGLLAVASQIVPVPTIDDGVRAKRPLFNVLDKSKTWELLAFAAPDWHANLWTMIAGLRDNG